jgi:Flp pilus assembly protein TadD
VTGPARRALPWVFSGALAAAVWLTCLIWGGVAHASLESGFTALTEGDLPAAEAAFQEVLDHDPRNQEAMRLLGVAYLEEGRTREAFSTLQTLRVLAPDDPKVHFALARVYYQAGLRPRERAELVAALRLDPDFTQAHRFLAHALVQDGELYGASAEYVWLKEEAEHRGEPVDAVVLFNLGLLDARLGRPDRATELLRRFLLREPEKEQAEQARTVLSRIEPEPAPAPQPASAPEPAPDAPDAPPNVPPNVPTDPSAAPDAAPPAP